MENIGHECSLFAIWAPETKVAWLTVQALDGQQTRGEEGAGIATTDGENFYIKKGPGLVIQVFQNPRSVKNLLGFAAIGHTRYSTTGRSKLCNVQPLLVESMTNGEKICLAHNGNIINASSLRSRLLQEGEVFQTTTDSEVIAKLLVRAPGNSWEERLRFVMGQIVGSYCLAILTLDCILLCRDPSGNRPLTIGRINGNYEAASESGVFKNQPSEFVREVDPGEIILLNKDGLFSFPQRNKVVQEAICALEFLYFMRPDSVLGGKESAAVRFCAGQILARNYPASADLIVPIPRSGLYAGDGFHDVSGIKIAHGVVANTHGRVFLKPHQQDRELAYDLKYSLLSIVGDKEVIVIDDSIIRGNSNRRVLTMFKKSGVSEIHFRSTFPPVVRPCHLGIDMATESELIAARYSSKAELEYELAKLWEIASVAYLTKDQCIEAIGLPEDRLCLGCVGGRYAYSLTGMFSKEQFEKAAIA